MFEFLFVFIFEISYQLALFVGLETNMTGITNSKIPKIHKTAMIYPIIKNTSSFPLKVITCSGLLNGSLLKAMESSDSNDIILALLSLYGFDELLLFSGETTTMALLVRVAALEGPSSTVMGDTGEWSPF